MTLAEQTLGIVLAHGRARDVVLRHAPVWRENASALVCFTPCDDPLVAFDYPQYSVGRSAAYSADTNLRTREALRFASYSAIPYVLLIEYDALVFGPIPPEVYPAPGCLTAPRFQQPPGRHRGGYFHGSQFLHFPILFSIDAVRRIVAQMDAMPLDAENGFTDRYVGYAAELAQISVLDLHQTKLVYTSNHIRTIDLPVAMEAIRAGARWHHGIKDNVVFEHLQACARGGM